MLGSRSLGGASRLFLGRCGREAIVFRTRTTNRARPCIILEHGIGAGTCARKRPVLLEQDFDGDAGEAQPNHADGQQKNLPFHGANLTTSVWMVDEKVRKFKLHAS